jgi:translocation and assembly module TamA
VLLNIETDTPNSGVAKVAGTIDALLLERWLKSHAQLWQFLEQPDLQPAEFDDLLARAPADLSALLQTRGYFNTVVRTTGNAAAPQVNITLGPVTTIGDVQLQVLADNAAPLPELAQAIRQQWTLNVGDTFTQSAWQSAKDQALNQLASQIYYQASIASSQAAIDPSTQRALLTLTLHSGPAFAFGPISVVGASRYDADQVLNLAQLAGLRADEPYNAQVLFEAQRRIVDNANYASAFLALQPVTTAGAVVGEPGAKAQLASTIEVREKPLQHLEASVGVSTDSGPRLHLVHTHYRAPIIGWQASHTLDWQRDSHMLSSNWLSPQDTRAWQWTGGLALKHQVDDDITTNTQEWRAGQTQSIDATQRTYYLQLERSKEQVRAQASAMASAVSGHWAWRQSQWDSSADPQAGQALSTDLSAGITLTQGAKPYLRGEAQWLHLSPFNNRQLGRISTKLGVGGVMANTDTAVPASSLFLTGGDTSVRGYALRSIGRTDRTAMAQGLVLPGRLMWLGALEWQRPTTWGGDAGRVEQTFFVDAGAVSNRLDEQTVFVGTGTGIRFISPVGPMQVDVAYGHQTKEWRLHLFVGIRF